MFIVIAQFCIYFINSRSIALLYCSLASFVIGIGY